MSKQSKASSTLRVQQLIAGVQKDLASYPSLTVGTVNMTPATIVTTLQKRIDLAQATANALAAYKAALKAERDENESTFVVAFVRMVEGMFFDSPNMLADFGLKPRSRATLTVAQKAAAVGQAAATRKARHTMGPKEKQAIKGQAPATPAAKPAT